MPEQETTPVINPNADPTTGIQIPANVPSDAWLAQQVESPTLPGMAVQAPVKQTIDEEKELLQQTTAQIPITPEAERAPVAAATPTTGETQAVTQQDNIEIERVQADQAVAEEGNVTPLSTVRGQLEQLMGDVESDDAPWADAAMRKANQAMSARGMGNSSIAAAAITQSVLEAAMPIAQYDASVYGTMNLQNLRNRQETMLSNTAASNVAKNMNAKTANEVQMFMNTMRDGVLKFNSTQHDAMSKFNAVQGTETSKFNAAQSNVANQFYAQMDDAAEKFNATNTLAISKTNAEWRRTINTANTAAVNTSNMVNAQNAFNMSQQAMADLWQRSRDVFNWANQSADNSKDRAFQMAMYSMQRADYMAEMSVRDKNDLWEGVGLFAHSLFEDVLEGTNWFGGE
jgi:hypothetical protein